MSLWTVLHIGIGVSADAFAVSLASGLKIASCTSPRRCWTSTSGSLLG